VTPHYRTTGNWRCLGRGVALLLLLAVANTPAVELYRWHDSSGQPHFGDTPPPQTADTERLTIAESRHLYVVEKVIDGDTIVVRGGGKVRLLGINAPEIAHRDQRAQPLGDEARQRLSGLLDAKRVYLEFDAQRRDRYERLLAHVTLEDGLNINELLLREGLARALFLQPNMRYLQRYYDAEGTAMAGRRGIWSRPEFQIYPSTSAKRCVKRFCRLRGKVLKVKRGRSYTILQLSGKVQASIKNGYLPQFLAAGVDINRVEGTTVIVRGWLGERKGQYSLQLQHPLQVDSIPP
jgi:micrococcal nuclease